MVKSVERRLRRPDYTYSATLDRVIDGDTIDVLIDVGFETTVFKRLRFLGVDTNELRSSDIRKRVKAKEAKQYVHDAINAADTMYIQTIMDSTGKYGRVLAYVWLETGDARYNLNAKLVVEGFDKADFI